MKSFLLTLLFLFAAVRTSTIDTHDKQVIAYWLSGLRGLWSGYQLQFHDTVDPKCFAAGASEDEVSQILTFLVYGQWGELLNTADAIYALFNDNLQHCAVQETFG